MALHYIIAFLILLRIIVNYLKNHTQLLKSLTEEKQDKQQQEQDGGTGKKLKDTTNIGGSTSKYISIISL
jgi:heme exporter protein D